MGVTERALTMSTASNQMTDTEHRPGVLVVGGGYAGLHAVRAAERAGVKVSVVDRSGDHDFVTRLASVAGGASPTWDAGAPLERFVDDVELGTVVAVHDGAVDLADGRRISADAVVVTAGAVPSRPPIPGLEHAHPLRSAEDARSLRSAIESTPSVVIVGGGATGVQLAAAVAHAQPEVRVDLVDAAPTLLAGLRSGLGRGAARILADRGVNLHLGRSVARIEPDGAELELPDGGGEFLDGLVVWAGGFDADAARLGVPTSNDGRIEVTPDLHIAGMERTFAAGDVAAHLDGDGQPLAMSAQVAVQAGTHAGDNAARVVLGRSTRPATLRQLGWVLDLAGRRGVAELGPIALAGPVLELVPPLLHDAIDVKNLLEIGGLRALRFAPDSVRSFLPRPPTPTWALARA